MVADALELAPVVDGILVVVDGSTTTQADVVRLRAQLDQVGGRLLGCVLNNLDPQGRLPLRLVLQRVVPIRGGRVAGRPPQGGPRARHAGPGSFPRGASEVNVALGPAPIDGFDESPNGNGKVHARRSRCRRRSPCHSIGPTEESESESDLQSELRSVLERPTRPSRASPSRCRCRSRRPTRRCGGELERPFVPAAGRDRVTVQRALVTGGAGFVGSGLVRGLLEAGYDVRVIDDLSTGFLENLAEVASDIELIDGSILDPAALADAMAGVRVAFHQAAIPSVGRSVEDPMRSHEADATGTLAVLIAARDAGVERVVYAASSSAYGERPRSRHTRICPRYPGRRTRSPSWRASTTAARSPRPSGSRRSRSGTSTCSVRVRIRRRTTPP